MTQRGTPNVTRTAAEHRAAIEQALRETGGRTADAAARLGVTEQTFYARCRRAGVSLRVAGALIRKGLPLDAAFQPPLYGVPTGVAAEALDAPAVATGQAVLTVDGHIRLTLADYAVLRARAEEAAEADVLRRDLAVAERIVVSLTRALQRRAAAA